jgi:hypothetical protein
MRTRRWSYLEPTGPDGCGEPVVITKTEQEILNEYYPDWSRRMLKIALTRPIEISHDACIEDWVVVNWAQRVTDDN